MTAARPSIIVIGGLNTDILGLKVHRLVGSGELTQGGELQISAGGKSRNIAQMIATLSGTGTVSMIGKTSCDPFGLWKAPIDALKNAGVNVDFISMESFEKTRKYPGIALIPVDVHGHNQIYVLPGINEDFSPQDIDRAIPLFDQAQSEHGMLVLTLECPFPTVVHAMRQANERGLRIMVDPGGAEEGVDYGPLLDNQHVFFLKPNAHEIYILTGQVVTDMHSARTAAQILLKRGVQHVLITMGSEGAYYFSEGKELHIPIPAIPDSGIHDETGCGDQTMAAICAALHGGKSIEEAIHIAIYAGTLQFGRYGIDPVKRSELNKILPAELAF